MNDPTTDDKPVERMCQVCNRAPVTVDGKGTDQTCATCVGNVRQHVKAIGIMAAALLGEAIRLNLNSNAADLAGPTADPEAWGYRRMSALAARIDPKWLDDQVDMHHPAWVLGTWEREARLHLDQLRDAGARSTLTDARDYLDQHLTRLAQDGGFAFDELATDVRQCHDHVERVLHLEEHIDRGAPCPACGKAHLEKAYGKTERFDHWRCPRCNEIWSETDYRLRVADDYLQQAKVLTAADIQLAHRVPTSTLRTWVQREMVKPLTRRDASGRQLFDVAQVLTLRDAPPATATG